MKELVKVIAELVNAQLAIVNIKILNIKVYDIVNIVIINAVIVCIDINRDCYLIGINDIKSIDYIVIK